MANVLLIDVFFVLMLLGGAWSVIAACHTIKPLTARGNLSLTMFANWYGYFFGVLLVILAIAGLCGAFR